MGALHEDQYNIHIYSNGPFILVSELLAKGQYPEGPATCLLGKGFLGFPVSVYKRILRWFPRLQVATACFSCSPPSVLIKLVP